MDAEPGDACPGENGQGGAERGDTGNGNEDMEQDGGDKGSEFSKGESEIGEGDSQDWEHATIRYKVEIMERTGRLERELEAPQKAAQDLQVPTTVHLRFTRFTCEEEVESQGARTRTPRFVRLTCTRCAVLRVQVVGWALNPWLSTLEQQRDETVADLALYLRLEGPKVIHIRLWLAENDSELPADAHRTLTRSDTEKRTLGFQVWAEEETGRRLMGKVTEVPCESAGTPAWELSAWHEGGINAVDNIDGALRRLTVARWVHYLDRPRPPANRVFMTYKLRPVYASQKMINFKDPTTTCYSTGDLTDNTDVDSGNFFESLGTAKEDAENPRKRPRLATEGSTSDDGSHHPGGKRQRMAEGSKDDDVPMQD
jgi:hypothetical protein